jgi:uncharacterized coiled-coil DUF342 family protein
MTTSTALQLLQILSDTPELKICLVIILLFAIAAIGAVSYLAWVITKAIVRIADNTESTKDSMVTTGHSIVEQRKEISAQSEKIVEIKDQVQAVSHNMGELRTDVVDIQRNMVTKQEFQEVTSRIDGVVTTVSRIDGSTR